MKLYELSAQHKELEKLAVHCWFSCCGFSDAAIVTAIT